MKISPPPKRIGTKELEVWHNHKIIKVFSKTHLIHSDGTDLVILDAEGVEVQRYRQGEWSAAHDETPLGYCASLTPDPSCERCNQPVIQKESATDA